jgi:hypothetical protein
VKNTRGLGFYELVQLGEAEIDRIINDLERGECDGNDVLAFLAEQALIGRIRSTGNIAGYRLA